MAFLFLYYSVEMRNNRMLWLWDWLIWVVVVAAAAVQGQQSYVNNKQADCYNHYNATDGNVCNGVASSCLSYLTFRSLPPYNNPTSIAYLLGSDATQIAAANNITDVDPIPTGTAILVPVNCSCTAGDPKSSSSSNNYYQHNASYVLKTALDTYFGVANNTYQGLTTCQALMAQNPFYYRNLTVGLTLRVPVRCACPTANQTASGVRFLVNYLVARGDDPSTIAQSFGIDRSSLLQANRLSEADTIYYFTPLLVPLTAQPSPTQLLPASPPAPPPSSSPPPPTSNSKSNNNKWIFVGVGVGASSLLLLVIAFFLLRRRRLQRRQGSPQSKLQASSGEKIKRSPGDLNTPSSLLPSSDNTQSKSWPSISSRGLRYAIESLTVYKLEELQRATEFFSEANRIKGSSVFRACFEGDDAAVKVIKGDVSLSEDEINLLKRINHSNIIRLSGFCVQQGHTYLVYEYAPSGSLADRLRSTDQSTLLSWKQRVQIAHDVADALNYLHNFTHPPYIHKNLKTSNILLDANFRAKVSDFGLARALTAQNHSHVIANQHEQDDQDEEEEEASRFQLTRHVVGTHGYMAPEYIQNGVITPKLDVFAFGVVLLELLSGREAAANDDNIDKNNVVGSRDEGLLLSASISGVLEGDHVRDKLQGFMDPSLRHEYPLELAFSMAHLAKSCVAPQINSRPTMAEAFMTISKILSSTLDWDPSDAHELQHSLGRGR